MYFARSISCQLLLLLGTSHLIRIQRTAPSRAGMPLRMTSLSDWWRALRADWVEAPACRDRRPSPIARCRRCRIPMRRPWESRKRSQTFFLSRSMPRPARPGSWARYRSPRSLAQRCTPSARRSRLALRWLPLHRQPRIRQPAACRRLHQDIFPLSLPSR